MVRTTSKNRSVFVQSCLCGLLCLAFISVSAGSLSRNDSAPPELSASNGNKLAAPKPNRGPSTQNRGPLSDSARENLLAALATRASLVSPFAPILSATKVDALTGDVDSDSKADPGDTLTYTVTISNTGPDPATNVNFADTIDLNTTLVAGTVAASPIAVNDAYNTIGNVHITLPAPGVITNDINPNGSGTLSVTQVNATPVPGGGSTTAATTNGSVLMNSNGGFTYTPNAGFTGPTDSFTYQLGNSATPGKFDTATVTITVSGRIWFVNSAAAVNGDGRLNTPFNILTGAGSADSVDAANDVIFLYSSATNYTGGISLNNGEKVIGQGASQSIIVITGFTAPSGTNLLPATGGADPTITTAGATAITLNSAGAGGSNGLHGFTVGNTGAAGTDIGGSSFGTLTVRDVSVKGDGRALNLATGTIATGSTFDLIESTGGSNNEGVRLNTISGTFTTPTTNIVNPTGTGIDVQSCTVAAGGFNFGATTANKSSTAGTGVNLNANTGTIAFTSLAVTTNNGTGVAATSSGTVNVTTGSIAATGGPALLVNPTTLGMTFTTVSSTASTTTGISLTSASGSLSIATTTITDAAGIGISVGSSSGTIGFGTTSITNPDANATGGTGVSLTSDSATITFGDLDITPETGQRGFHATSCTGTITTTSGDIVTSGATAVEIVGVSSGSRTPLNMALTKTTATGSPANGILLQN
ncbi:MAG TPA: Ig-like domain-containing protein, partial [Blastocatellia bacterium]|nr:Ig-like domain-containing protein [Blastocatellia bacterium]